MGSSVARSLHRIALCISTQLTRHYVEHCPSKVGTLCNYEALCWRHFHFKHIVPAIAAFAYSCYFRSLSHHSAFHDLRRNSLAASFLFKFFIYVSTELRQRGDIKEVSQTKCLLEFSCGFCINCDRVGACRTFVDVRKRAVRAPGVVWRPGVPSQVSCAIQNRQSAFNYASIPWNSHRWRRLARSAT